MKKNLKVKIFYIGNSERAVRAVLPMALAEGGGGPPALCLSAKNSLIICSPNRTGALYVASDPNPTFSFSLSSAPHFTFIFIFI